MSKKHLPYKYCARVSRVIDGDTIAAQVDLGFKISVEKTLRLARINSPELAAKEGVAAREYLQKYLLEDNDGAIIFTSKKLDNYGRSIAEIQIASDGEQVFLSDLMVVGGHAVYKGY